MKVIAILALMLGFSASAQDVYTIDPAHTSIVFKVNHMDFSNVYGMFTEADGKITVDEKAPEKSSFEVTIKADSVFTHQKKRDDHLRSPDFFNVKQFPTITLKSKSVKKSGDKYDVTADLTLHGVTKLVNFTFTRMKTGKDPMGATRTGGEGHLKIKRTDFGMNFMSKPGEVGDEIELMFGVEGVKK
jgi:polyisoprenoid-binding protein YceI